MTQDELRELITQAIYLSDPETPLYVASDATNAVLAIVSEQIEAARREGAEAMREWAAQWHDEQAARWKISDPSYGAHKRHESHASRIRALPLPRGDQ